jgi:hypothetical protein
VHPCEKTKGCPPHRLDPHRRRGGDCVSDVTSCHFEVSEYFNDLQKPTAIDRKKRSVAVGHIVLDI